MFTIQMIQRIRVYVEPSTRQQLLTAFAMNVYFKLKNN